MTFPNRFTVTLLALLALAAGACDAFNRNTGPQPIPQTTVTLLYNESSVVVQNNGDVTMGDPSRLVFVRGEPGAGGDDYNASRMTSGALTPGECYTMVRRGSNALVVNGCTGTNGTEVLTNITGLFWKAEPTGATEFSARWDDTVVARCETYSIEDTGTKQCTFLYPPEGATTGG